MQWLGRGGEVLTTFGPSGATVNAFANDVALLVHVDACVHHLHVTIAGTATVRSSRRDMMSLAARPSLTRLGRAQALAWDSEVLRLPLRQMPWQRDYLPKRISA
jgi:hypothetical protein